VLRVSRFSSFYLKFKEEIANVLKQFHAEYFLSDRTFESIALDVFHEVYHLLPKDTPKKTA